ncbi:hypothetical protein [Paraburkholderia sp. FT54]|uniref:hypothetical protein n=1 Tax=Paraburkholderia sp. FT54 TaxID=3074437 RepID=UPI0038F666F8
MDAAAAAQIVRDGEAVDRSCRAFGRRTVTQMKEAPHIIPIGLEYYQRTHRMITSRSK